MGLRIVLLVFLVALLGAQEQSPPHVEYGERSTETTRWWWPLPPNMDVIRVIDGDSIRVTAHYLPAPLSPHLILRLFGVDAPETGWRALCPEEAEAGRRATEASRAWLRDHLDATVVLRRWDKYGGRVLGDLVHPQGNLTTNLSLLGVVLPYHGHARPQWCKLLGDHSCA